MTKPQLAEQALLPPAIYSLASFQTCQLRQEIGLHLPTCTIQLEVVQSLLLTHLPVTDCVH